MTQQTFRDRLARLFDQFLSEGGDPWWLSREVSVASMAILGELRTDLVEIDEEEEVLR